MATETHFAESRVTARATINHIGSEKIGRLLASIQASHQRKMFELSGIDIQSQAAYELACKGTIRPADNRQPMIYGIRLAEFRKPFFTIGKMRTYVLNAADVNTINLLCFHPNRNPRHQRNGSVSR